MQTQVQTQTETYTHVLNPVKWDDAIGLANRYCKTIVNKGGAPIEAVRGYGVTDESIAPTDWDNAAQIIALAMCKPAHQRPC